MSTKNSLEPNSTSRVGSAQNLAGGIVLIMFAALAIWLTRDLPRGTLNSVGPAMLPQAVAVLVGICGIALAVAGVVKPSHDEPMVWSLRGPLLVTISIIIFALTIKPMHFGSFDTVELGLVISGPLAIVVGGYASPQARFRDLLLLALALTPFCMILFGDLLNLPIPILPPVVSRSLFAGYSFKTALRVTSVVLLIAAVIFYWATRGRGVPPAQVAKHEGTN